MTDPLDHMAFLEATNAMADAMDGMKSALISRGWSEAMSEQVGAAFGSALFQMTVNKKGGGK